MPIKKITKEAETKLLKVLNKVADYVSDGKSPNDAIVKAASETDMTPHQIQLIVQAYNNAKFNNQRTSSSLVSEKMANFDIANPKTIFDKLYPNVKEAQAVESEEVSSDYNSRPDRFHIPLMITSEELMTKEAAGLVSPAASKPAPVQPGMAKAGPSMNQSAGEAKPAPVQPGMAKGGPAAPQPKPPTSNDAAGEAQVRQFYQKTYGQNYGGPAAPQSSLPNIKQPGIADNQFPNIKDLPPDQASPPEHNVPSIRSREQWAPTSQPGSQRTPTSQPGNDVITLEARMNDPRFGPPPQYQNMISQRTLPEKDVITADARMNDPRFEPPPRYQKALGMQQQLGSHDQLHQLPQRMYQHPGSYQHATPSNNMYQNASRTRSPINYMYQNAQQLPAMRQMMQKSNEYKVERDTEGLVKKSWSLLKELENQYLDKKSELFGIKQSITNSFDNLLEYFKKASARSKVGYISELSEAYFGKEASVILNYVIKEIPHLEKESFDKSEVFSSFDVNDEPFSYINNIILKNGEYNKKTKEFNIYCKEAGEANYKLMSTFLPKQPLLAKTGSIVKQAEDELLKSADALDSLPTIAAGLEKLTTQPNVAEVANTEFKPQEKIESKSLLALKDPNHENKLRQIRSQAVFHDMLANDPFLSGENPERVAKLYNEITRLSPRSADQPLAMRSFLRRYLAQGQVDPHDVDQLVTIENKLKQKETGSKINESSDLG